MEDPIYVCSLWDPHKQEVWADPQASGVEQDASEKEEETSVRNPRATSEQELKRQRAQQLLAEANKALSEACSLCLQHQLPPSILSEICLNMLETHGLSDPAVTGQFLALLQSCHCVSLMSKVLTAACSDSQPCALLHSDRDPNSLPQAAQASLTSLPKAFSHLSINPSHLSLLSELPPNVKLLLLQHAADRKELYGAFYEVNAKGNLKGKTAQTKGGLTCSKVAKVPVCPRTLLTLLDQAQTLGQEIRQVRLKEASYSRAGGMTQPSQESQDVTSSAAEQALMPLFRELVHSLEVYLNPLLSQFDFTCLRPMAAALESNRPKDIEDKPSSATFPAEMGEYLVLLADQTLLQFPLEALSVLHEENLTSVSRDFSLQLLHRRLQESEKVEGDNKKETKGGKGAKAKGDQSQAIKARPFVLPPNTVPVNSKNFKYVVDPYNDGVFDGSSLSKTMSEILETHSQLSAHLWEGLMGSKYRPSVAEIEQLLSRCSAFIFLGMERFTGNITPAKLAALNLSDCRLALLFDLVQNSKSVARQSDLDKDKSPGQRALESPLETALLLSLGGVGGIALNQWHSSFQLNAKHTTFVLEGLLKEKLTSGQAIHSLRKGQHPAPRSPKEKVTSEISDHAPHIDAQSPSLTPAAYNCVLYGLPNLIVP